MQKFLVGDVVKWSSSAGGVRKTKTGTVVGIVPAWTDFMHVKSRLDLPPNKSAWGGGMRRERESYIVMVPKKGKGLPTIYWPRETALSLLIRKLNSEDALMTD